MSKIWIYELRLSSYNALTHIGENKLNLDKTMSTLLQITEMK